MKEWQSYLQYECYTQNRAALVAQRVKNLPAMQETLVQSLGKIPWRRAWQPTPVFLFGESHGQRSLVGSMGDHKELDMTEQLSTAQHTQNKL